MILYHEDFSERVDGYLNCSSYVAMKQIHTIVPFVLLLVGTIGNALSLMVLTQRSMRRLSMYNYLAVLSVVDTLFLYCGLLPEWLKNILGFSITNLWLCKLKNVMKYTVSQFSVWIIVAVTVERYIATVHMFNASRMCTRRRAAIIMLCMFSFLLIMNGHLFFTSTIKFYNSGLLPSADATFNVSDPQNYSSSQCVITENPYIKRIWPWTDACFYSFVPFLVILTLNVLIIRAVHSSETNRRLIGRIAFCDNKNSPAESESRLTRLLMVISFVFLITTLPVNIVWIVQKIVTVDPICQRSQFVLALVIGRMLMYTNHSVNFFLYLFSGIKFRHKLLAMCFHANANLKRRGQQFYSLVSTSNRRTTVTSQL